MLQDIIKIFDCVVFLRMIRSDFHMMDPKFFRQGLHGFIDKVRTSIAHQDFWTSKSGQNLLKDEVRSGICSAILNCLCLGPPSHIISSSYNVTCTCPLSKGVDRSYQIDAPLVKCL